MQSKLVIGLCCACLVPLTAGAQRPAVTDPAAPVAADTYQSAFSTYKPYQEQVPGSWRELNEEVSKAGGHVGIFGGAGNARHGAGKTPAAAPKPSAHGPEAAGQPPVRGAPAAPAGKPHH